MTTLPGSALPVMVGVVSSVVPPEVSGPWFSPTSSVTVSIVAAIGAVVSIVSSAVSVAALPFGSVAVAV